MHKQRLLNVARALRESPDPDAFDMTCYAHPCGTPACALGHYAARPDLQSAFRLDEEWMVPVLAPASDGKYDIALQDPEVRLHFGLDITECCELFGRDGCGSAKSAVEAAEYIEAFCRRHEVSK